MVTTARVPARPEPSSMGRPMSADEQLLYETRVRNRQAIIAMVAGVLLIVASVDPARRPAHVRR